MGQKVNPRIIRKLLPHKRFPSGFPWKRQCRFSGVGFCHSKGVLASNLTGQGSLFLLYLFRSQNCLSIQSCEQIKLKLRNMQSTWIQWPMCHPAKEFSGFQWTWRTRGLLKTSLHCNLLSSYPQSSMTTEGQPMDSGYTLMNLTSLLPYFRTLNAVNSVSKSDVWMASTVPALVITITRDLVVIVISNSKSWRGD